MTSPPPPELVGLSYSAWTLKARWSLDAHEVEYRFVEYLPMLGEPALRLRLGTPLRKASVPVLFTEAGPFTDSWDIAQWAAANASSSERLISDANRAAVADWNARSERLLAAGRARTTRRVMRDPAALAESVPPPLNQLGPLTRGIGALGARFLLAKYRGDRVSEEAAEAAMRIELDALRAGLAGRETLLDDFSYADVAMALGFCFIAPPGGGRVRIGVASLPHWSFPELAVEYADLVGWAERIFARWPLSRAVR